MEILYMLAGAALFIGGFFCAEKLKKPEAPAPKEEPPTIDDITIQDGDDLMIRYIKRQIQFDNLQDYSIGGRR